MASPYSRIRPELSANHLLKAGLTIRVVPNAVGNREKPTARASLAPGEPRFALAKLRASAQYLLEGLSRPPVARATQLRRAVVLLDENSTALYRCWVGNKGLHGNGWAVPNQFLHVRFHRMCGLSIGELDT